MLEFRVFYSAYGQSTVRVSKRTPLEKQIPAILGALVRGARNSQIDLEEKRQQEIARRQREMELLEFGEQIKDEEQKLSNLDGWVTNWARARQYREFINAPEQSWKSSDIDTSPEADRGKRLIWMRQQADRLVPLVESPPSILDRKRELTRSWAL